MTTRTRLGKVVGSITTDPNGFTYWAEKDWSTGEDGFVVVAPSGARMSWFPTETEAMFAATAANAEWFGTYRPARCAS